MSNIPYYGLPVGAEFFANTITNGVQDTPQVAALSGGGFVVVWRDNSGSLGAANGSEIRGQRFDANGARVGSEFLINETITTSTILPSVSGAPGGGFVVAWTDATNGTRTRAFAADGNPASGEIQVQAATGSGGGQTGIATLPNGQYLIVWQAPGDGGGDVKARLYNASHQPIGGEFNVASGIEFNQVAPRVTAVGNEFVVTWADARLVGGVDQGLDIIAQRIDANGLKLGVEIRANTTIAGNQSLPSVTALAGGGFAIAWADVPATTDATTAIRAQRFDAIGGKVGGELVVSTGFTGTQTAPTIAALADGSFGVTWADITGTGTTDRGIFGQQYNLDGSLRGNAFQLSAPTNAVQNMPAGAVLTGGRIVTAWFDSGAEPGSTAGGGVEVQILQPLTRYIGTTANDTYGGTSADEAIEGFEGNDTLAGGAGFDLIDGGAGNDTLNGGSEDDGIWGDAGNDTIFGDAGNDQLIGGAGNDVIDGGAGTDIAFYGGPRSAYQLAVLADGRIRVTSAAEGVDLLTSVERLGFSDGVYAPPTGLVAQSPTLVYAGFGSSMAAGSWTSQNVYPRSVADVNGDGRGDLIGFGQGGVVVALGLAGGGFGAASAPTGNFGSGTAAGGWTSQTDFPRIVTDMNGDGRADVVGFGSAGVYIALGNGSGGFATPSLAFGGFGSSTAAGGWTSQTLYPRAAGDVNGDGRADLIGFGDGGVYVALQQANGSFATAILGTTQFGAGSTAGSWTSQDLFPRMLADVNGDGRSDIVAFGDGGAFVSFGQSNGSFSAAIVASTAFGRSPAAGAWTSNNDYPRYAADINGDKFADLVGFGDAGVFVQLGNGDGSFGAVQQVVAGFGQGASGGGWSSQNGFPRLVADVTGDGQADIVGFGDGGVYVAPALGFTLVA